VGERHALLIGVPRFTRSHGRLDDLDFAVQSIEGLAQVLHDSFGYAVETVTEPGLTSVRLGKAVRSALEAAGPDDVLIVHLLTHGRAADESLYALGSDGATHESTEIGRWLAGLQTVEGRPLALFTLDLCESGLVTSLPWQAKYDSVGRRGWVLAACEPDQDAFNGHFTKALTTVLRDLANHDLEVDPALKYIPLGTVACAVRRVVTHLANVTHSYQQYVTASRVDISVEPPVPPLFVNPMHLDTPRTQLRAAIGPALLPFLDDLDEGLDVRHFIERASGSAAVHDLTEGLAGCFSGRAPQLRELSRWLNGEGDQTLSVVTGSPGVGKSALLGLLVCAAHPKLRGPTKPVWDRVTQTPMPIGLLGAVHARQRGLSAIAAALGRQLGLGDEMGVDDFLRAIRMLPDQRPVVILDALDEAEGTEEVAAWLLRLASLTRPDDSPAVRLLVGTRTYDETAALRELASGPAGLLFDLDRVDRRVLEDDLHEYVSDLLRATPAYRHAGQITGAFAAALAETLAGNRSSEWGEFLVAGLYTRHFISTFELPEHADAAQLARATAAARRKGREVPGTLPKVLELDLAHHPDEPWLRPVLTALAHARGSGLPASVIGRVAGALRPDAPPPSLAETQTALRAGRFYLRQSSDEEKVTVYRLFHEGLAQHLRRTQDADKVFEALVAALGPPGQRVWAAAEPYVLQHAIDHAPDPAALLEDCGFLLYTDPASYLPLLNDEARRRVEALRTRGSPTARRAAFARTAAAQGRSDLALRMTDLPGEQPLPWLPLWARGRAGTSRTATSAPVAVARGDRGQLRVWDWTGLPLGTTLPQVSTFALRHQNGRLMIIIGSADGTMHALGPDRAEMGFPAQPVPLTALAVADHSGGPVVLSAAENGKVLTHALATGHEIRSPVTVPGAPVSVLAAGGHDLTPVVACVNAIGELWAWRLEENTASILYPWELPSAVLSVAVSNLSGRPVLLVGCADGTARSWDYETRTPLKTLQGHGGPVPAVAIGALDGRTVAVTGGHDGKVRMWDMLTGRRLSRPLQVCHGQVSALALLTIPGGLLCLVGSSDATMLWDLVEGSPLREFDLRGATLVALGVEDSGPIMPGDDRAAQRLCALEIAPGPHGKAIGILGDAAGTVYAIDLDSGQQVHDPLAAVGYPVTSIGTIRLGGLPTAIIRSGSITRLWQLSTGAVAAIRADQEPRESALPPWEGRIIVGDRLVNVRGTAAGSVLIDDALLGMHGGEVTAITTTHLAGRPVALTGDLHGSVRIWDLARREMADELEVGSPVFAIAATADGRLMVGADGQAFAFRHLTAQRPES
jgi:hypothetical protein